VAMRDGPQAGLALVDELMAQGHLHDYHLAHATRADLYRRMGRLKEARNAYQDALRLTRQGPEQRFLQQRLDDLGSLKN
jgi:RNA polymerase sigma-70 factor, ECF subfamily